MDHDDNLDIPESLIAKLTAGDEVAPMITSRADRAVASRAKAQFASRHRYRRRTWLAAAAAAAVALFLFEPRYLDEPAGTYVDVDGSGRIDIADVLALARSNAASNAELDAFARTIVALDGAPQ